MIKLQTLRLHNTVLHDERPGRVMQLTEDGAILQYENGELSSPVGQDDLNGVQLTPDMLKHSGFLLAEHNGTYYFVLNDDAQITVNPHILGGYSVQLCVKGLWCGKPISTLHELQNIYIDLTGEAMATD